MADNLTPFDPAGAPTAPAPQGGLRGFINSKVGKLVIGGALVLVLLGVLFVIGLGFLGSWGLSKLANSATPVDSGGTVTKSPVEVAAVKLPADVELDDVFVYRDIFVPTIQVTAASSETTSTGTSGDTGSGTTSTTTTETVETPPNTLVLTDITSENGEQMAIVAWDGKSYALAEGETIPGTPWQVSQINESTVVMLYGDQEVTLSVGVGVSK